MTAFVFVFVYLKFQPEAVFLFVRTNYKEHLQLLYTYSVCIDDFTNRNINNWFSESHQVRIFVNIKFILQFRDLAGCLKKTS